MSRVLVVDDDPEMCELLKLMLEEMGHQVEYAEDGDAGLQMYREGRHDVVLMDIFMPGKEGLETIRELRAGDPNARVIAISGGSRRTDMCFLPAAELLGAVRALAKPIRFDDLRDAIIEALEAPMPGDSKEWPVTQ